MPEPTPHLEKLLATLANDKLPDDDKPRLQVAVGRYRQWIADLDGVIASCQDPSATLTNMVRLLNEYRRYID